MQHRRILVPLALAGSFGIALAPSFAAASTTPHSAASSVFGSAASKNGALNFSSPASKSVYSRHAVSSSGIKANTTAATTNPDLTIAIGAVQTSAYGMELVAGISGLNSGSATLTVNWGDGSTPKTYTVAQGTTSLEEPYTYSAVGTYTITATLDDGSGGDTATNSVLVQTASEYTPYGPVRILDTRIGTGATKGAVAAHGTVKLQVTGAGTSGNTVPAGITAVVLNVTATQPTASGVVTAYNDEDADGYSLTAPSTSNLNFGKGQTVANLVVVPVGADGVVDLYNNSSGVTQMVADVEGYYTTSAASTYKPVTPKRILDTRKGTGTGKVAKVASDGTVTLKVAGDGTVPSTATAVQLNITVTNGTHNGNITAYAGNGTPTSTSNVNYAIGQTVANSAIVPLGTSGTGTGELSLYNSSGGTVDLIADVSGYYLPSADGGSTYVPLYEPTRLYDSRVKGNGVFDGPLSAGKTVPFPITYDTGETAFVLNATVTSTTGAGYLELYPYNSSATALPGTSTLNWVKGQTIPNTAVVSAGTVLDKNFDSYDLGMYIGGTGTAQVVLDAFGFFPSN
ncbi:hypothetical protein KDK95_00475 [Actinospica sp. MGRD01-02]|uniref:PKD domain-containing protein n=1 Tax=Actinospica acidithermotolerans TaxID=2828514 RepID=A0A941E275_9ACTN|nr:hypothetical protein [Actinospica acidithermotolerans]MBR7824765.1 hypothetical protein [Actinospica acidithermotolerans]